MAKQRGRAADDALGERLLLPLDFELERAETAARGVLAALTAFLCVAFAIMALAPVREVAIAIGEIKPVAEITELRHVEGGEVRALFRREGDRVRAGDPIVGLRPVAVEADYRQLIVRRAYLRARYARLTAAISGSELVFPDDPDIDPSVSASETALHVVARRAHDTQRAALLARREQRLLDAAGKKAEVAAIEQELAAVAAQREMRRRLEASGSGTLEALIEADRRVAEARSRHEAARAAAQSAISAVTEAEAEIARAEAGAVAEWSREAQEVGGQIAELDRSLARLADRVERTVVRAPIDGVIQDLGGLTVGSVLTPGGLAAKIVPAEGDLIAEVRVSPGDIGHVALGSTAVVTVTTYDRELIGDITGTVTTLSPAAFENERGERFFTAELALGFDARAPRRARLSAGMVVQAEIKTGSKTILAYLFSPVLKAAERAFAER